MTISSGSVKVTGQDGFQFGAGTLTLQGGTLTLGPVRGSPLPNPPTANNWTGGAIQGTGGTLNVTGGELDVNGNANYCSAYVNIGQDANQNPGIVKMGPPNPGGFPNGMSSNVLLTGYNPRIQINNGGTLDLEDSTSAATTDTVGGIWGAVSSGGIYVYTGGLLERGSPTTSPSGSVRVDPPIYVQGGTVEVWGNSNTPTITLHLRGIDPSYGNSLLDTTSSGGAVYVYENAVLRTDNAIRIDTTVGDGLTLFTGTGLNPTVMGDVNVAPNVGGRLQIRDPQTGHTGEASITGNVTLGPNSFFSADWTSNPSLYDWLNVNGDITLGGTLDMEGAGPGSGIVDPVTQWSGIADNDFSAWIRNGDPGTVLSHRFFNNTYIVANP